MGRGRAKAKQVKVARQLKYSGGGGDLDRLRAELGVSTDQQQPDDYADLADRYSAHDDEPDDDDLDGDDLDGDGADDDLDDDIADDRADGYPHGWAAKTRS
jgi:Protein of unknown function (DUF3073)